MCSDKQLNETIKIKYSPFYLVETMDVKNGVQGAGAPFQLIWLHFLNTLKVQKCSRHNFKVRICRKRVRVYK